MMEINTALCLSLAPCSNQNSNFLFSFVSIFFYYPISFLYSTLSSAHYYYSCIVFHLSIYHCLFKQLLQINGFHQENGKDLSPTLTPGDTWQCLQSFWFGGKNATGDQWVEGRDTANHPTVQRMKLEPIIQSEVNQKDKDHYNILTHIQLQSPQQRIYLVQKYQLVLRLRNHDIDEHLGSLQSWLVQNCSTNNFVNLLLYINPNIFFRINFQK